MAVTQTFMFLLAAFGTANYDSIQRLNLQAKATSFELERFHENVDSIASKAIEDLQGQIASQKEELQRISNDATQTKRDIQYIHSNASALALLLTKVTWLQLSTKNEFGGDTDAAARKHITNELNNILLNIIPQQKDRDQWIQEMYKLLPQQ